MMHSFFAVLTFMCVVISSMYTTTRVLLLSCHICVCVFMCVTVGMGAHRAQDVPETTHRHTPRAAVLGDKRIYTGSHTDILPQLTHFGQEVTEYRAKLYEEVKKRLKT